jgi:hypothetical protein
MVSGARYQRLFREFIAGWQPGAGEPAQLRAEMAAAAVVAAHNHVLRRWLRGQSPDPVREVDAALRLVSELFGGPAGAPEGGTTVVAFRTGQDIDSLLPALRRIAGQPA